MQSSQMIKFSELIGNTNTISLQKKALLSGRYPHFVLNTGPMGTGKTSVSQIVAMYLTCESPDKKYIEPCGECRICKQNINILSTTGIGNYIVKKNMGSIEANKEMSDTIREIFAYKAGIGNKVFILEEIHLLSTLSQGMILEELGRLDEHCYVIACSTRPLDILPELKNRAISFSFNILNHSESLILLDRELKRNKLNKLGKEEEEFILKASKNIPRTLVNTVQFLASSQPTIEELHSFLGYISQEVFLEIFMNTKDPSYFLQSVSNLVDKYSYEFIYEQLQQFVLYWMFSIFNVGEFSETFNRCLKPAIDFKTVRRIRECIRQYPRSSVDLEMIFWDIKNVLDNRGEGSKVMNQVKIADDNRNITGTQDTMQKLTAFNPKSAKLGG